jgi:site-specific DNA-methyltransferase (cytosine-N4-specific)
MSSPMMNKHYFSGNLGSILNCSIEDFISSSDFDQAKGKVQLIFTSPPFALNSPKEYGNQVGTAFIDWLAGFSKAFQEMLTPDGSIVIELGNNWVKGYPCISLNPMVALMKFLGKELNLCQEFIIFNKTRLPLPTKWVCVDKIRCKDQFNKAWWMAKNPWPKTRLKNVLTPYAESTKQQIKDAASYTDSPVPSGHIFKRSKMKDNEGAIPSSVLTFPHTKSSGDKYLTYCKENSIPIHPARMQDAMADFFIKFLTDEGDLVFDPFAGSNVTGYRAELLNRKWMSVERDESYCKGSVGRWEK